MNPAKYLKGTSLSVYAIALIVLVTIIIDLSVSRKTETSLMNMCDVQQYYAYLPAALIHKDLSLSYVNDNPEKFAKYVWGIPSPSPKPLIMVSSGLAILYSPTFLISHFMAKLLGYEADGYSLPYYIGLQFNFIIYLFIGFYFLRKLLLKYFSDSVTTATMLMLFFGTNLFYYATYESPLPHGYEFSIFIIFIYYTIGFYEMPGIKYATILGILSGIIALIRPTDIIILLIFLFWGISGIKDFRERIVLLLNKWYLLVAMTLLFIVVWIPQFIYWKYITGHYLFYSYDSTSHFDFLSPHIIKGLFSYRKGWLVYTPVMALSLTGIFILIRKYKGLSLPIGIFTLVNIYIVLSWFCWWYGGSFGLRAFVDSYCILSIPLAAFISWAFQRKKLIRIIIICVLGLLMLLNLFQTAQYRNGAIHYANMTKKAYWETFGKLRPTANFYKYLEDPLKELK
jgi:hypothetical protein